MFLTSPDSRISDLESAGECIPESELSLLALGTPPGPGGCIRHLARFSLDGVRLREDRLPPRGILLTGGFANLLSSFLTDFELVFSFLTELSFFEVLLELGVLGLDASGFDFDVVLPFFELNSLSSIPGDCVVVVCPLLIEDDTYRR